MYSATFKGDGAPTVRVMTFSLKAMLVDYRAWIEKHGLGASHCDPVYINDLYCRTPGESSYRLSYNGRVWHGDVEVTI